MGQVLVDSNSLTAIAEAIRSKNKKVIKYKPNEMAGAIKALALDNSVVIQSNDAWKYANDPALEHQNISVAINAGLIGDNRTGYKSKITFDPTIKSNFGYVAGTIKKTIDSTNHIINFSANPNPATEISGMLQDGWTPVYVVNNKYYTTTTPDNIESLKSVSSSDNIENLLICGYYNIDKSTNKLVATEPTTLVGPLSSEYTKNYQNKYIKKIDYHGFYACNALTTVDISNITSIASYAIQGCEALKTVDISNVTSIASFAIYGSTSTTYIILNNNTPPSISNYSFDNNLLFLIPNAANDAYKSNWSSIADRLDFIENYDITRANCTIIVKNTLYSIKFSINTNNNTNITASSNLGISYDFKHSKHVFFYDNEYMYLVSDITASGARCFYKALSLKITRSSDNLGGTLEDANNYSYGPNDAPSGFGVKFKRSSYLNQGCTIDDLIMAFKNGETLNFEIRM